MKYIAYAEVKKAVTMEMVLARCGQMERLVEKGENHVGPCRLCGAEKDLPFSVDLEKSRWQCFACKAKGNIFDYVQHLEDLEDVNAAAWFINDKFMQEESDEPKPRGANKPLTFSGLKHLSTDHEDLAGFLPGTLEHFGVGYCKRGFFKGRVVVAIHNQAGELVAYAARGEKGWVYPTKYGYDPDLDLYNAHRCEKGRAVFVVDDYFDVLRLYEQGITNVILAPTSEVQVDILLSLEPTDYFKSVESPRAA